MQGMWTVSCSVYSVDLVITTATVPET